jgi:hypothetical protein
MRLTNLKNTFCFPLSRDHQSSDELIVFHNKQKVRISTKKNNLRAINQESEIFIQERIKLITDSGQIKS